MAHVGVPPALLHLVPQPPQFEMLVAVLASQPLDAILSQSAKPGLQVASRQTPATQLDVAFEKSQMFPQLPQLFASEPISMQVPPQGTRPAGQAHALAWQVRPPVQALPQAPQFVLLERKSSSQPFAALPSQSPKPVTHEKPQVLAVHVAVAFDGVAQALLQVPQLLTLVVVLTQLPPQEVGVPPEQVAVQALLIHTWPDEQGVAQVPQ